LFSEIQISVYKKDSARHCGTGRGKVEGRVRNYLSKRIDDGHKVSGLHALKKRKMLNRKIGFSEG
jgi:hypothetical protein